MCRAVALGILAVLAAIPACNSVNPKCSSGSDCQSGICDLGAHECTVGVLTIDSTGFVIDGARWWTTTSGPKLTGTFEGVSSSRIVAVVDGNETEAVLTDTTWSAQLPMNSIKDTDTPITIKMTNASGGDVELNQAIALDSIGPSLDVMASTIRDERGDTIDFTTGEPVHTHAGPEIDLASGCPTVYRYAYLMGSTRLYGSETTPNPLAWKFKINEVKLEPGSMFRVRTEENQTVLDWTELPAPVDGLYSIELNRDGGSYSVASLGTRTGKFYLDVRATDWTGIETTSSICWDHQPLAPPLEITALENDALFAMTLAADSPISNLIGGDGGVGIVGQTIKQHTAEPITFQYKLSTGAVQYGRTFYSDFVSGTRGDGNTYLYCCSGTAPDARCSGSPPTHPAQPASTASGTVGQFGFANYARLVLRDEANGQAAATVSVGSASMPSDLSNITLTGTIPARAMGEVPHTYRLLLIFDSLDNLKPGLAPFGEHSLAGQVYTGTPSTLVEKCSQTISSQICASTCVRSTEYRSFNAIDRAELMFGAFSASLKTGFELETTYADIHNAPSSAFMLGAASWDSGNDDLPGPD